MLAAIQRLRSKAQAAGNLKSQQGADGHDGAGSRHDGHQDRAGRSADGLRADLQLRPCVRAVAVSGLSAVRLLPAGLCRRARRLFAFAAGVAVGAALWGNCNWGGGNVNVNVNKYNNFNRTNIQNSNWQHNAEHRKGVQYRDPPASRNSAEGTAPGRSIARAVPRARRAGPAGYRARRCRPVQGGGDRGGVR